MLTRRLVLRAFEEADRDPFAALNRDPEVVRHLQGPMSRERSDAHLSYALTAEQWRLAQ